LWSARTEMTKIFRSGTKPGGRTVTTTLMRAVRRPWEVGARRRQPLYVPYWGTPGNFCSPRSPCRRQESHYSCWLFSTIFGFGIKGNSE
jgi:hypothetical protein